MRDLFVFCVFVLLSAAPGKRDVGPPARLRNGRGATFISPLNAFSHPSHAIVYRIHRRFAMTVESLAITRL